MAKDTKPAELPDDASHEEIVEYLDQVAVGEGEKSGAANDGDGEADGEGNAADDGNGDGKPTPKAKGTSKTKTKSTKTKSSVGDDDDSADDDDDSADDESDGEGQGKKGGGDGQDWLDDSLKAEATAMGITDDQLSEISSREELDRAMRLLGGFALAAGRRAGERDTGKTDAKDDKPKNQLSDSADRDTDGRFKAKSKSQQQRNNGDADDSAYKVQLSSDDYDEAVVQEFNKLRDHYEERFQAMEERFTQFERGSQEREAKAEEQRMDAIIDTLGFPELFGESGKETDAEYQNRKKLVEESLALSLGMKALGRDGEISKPFMSRVAKMTFADHISKKERKQLTRRMSKQSDMRMGGGSAKSKSGEFKGPPEKNPDLHAMFKELEDKSDG